MGWFNLGNIAAVVLAAMVYRAVMNLRDLTDPLRGYDESSGGGSTPSTMIGPSWESGQKFHLCAFISRSSRFNPFKLSEKAENKELLLSKRNLVFDNRTQMDDVTIHLDLIDDNEFKSRRNMKEEEHPSSGGHGETEDFPLEVVLPQATWKYLRTNSTNVFLHVVLLKASSHGLSDASEGQRISASPWDLSEYNNVTTEMIKSGRALYGVVRLLKHDKIQKRQLSRYLLTDYIESFRRLDSLLGGVELSKLLVFEMPPAQRSSSRMRPDSILSFWKPEVAVRTVADWTVWPYSYAPDAVLQRVSSHQGQGEGKKGANNKRREYTYPPALYVDEIGLTSEKYVPVNSSVSSLPLKLTYGSLGLQRWLLMQEFSASLQMQKDAFGFTDNDVDDVRRLIGETSVWLLCVTALASLLHFVFEILAFQSDIKFWKDVKSLAGLSARAVVAELVSQCVVLLFLLDSDTSVLVIIPAAAGVMIQLWKVQRATGLTVGLSGVSFRSVGGTCSSSSSSSSRSTSMGGESIDETADKDKEEAASAAALVAASQEADKYAMGYLLVLVLPLVLANAARSLIMDMHCSWYSWFISSLTASVYALGFVLMMPQLYINHKLKSVSSMPWTYLSYRFINTFIDDLFAFVIKMPTMHRISVFRDDLVFLVYLYQRYTYSVDEKRPVEK